MTHPFERNVHDCDPSSDDCFCGDSNICARCGEHRDEGIHDPINAEQPNDPTAEEYLGLAKALAKQAHEAAEDGMYDRAQQRHRDAADAFAAYESKLVERS